MKAVLMTGAGKAHEVLRYTDIETPEITTHTQVKVQLKAAGINPIDTKIRGRGLFYENALPAVLGCDGVGVIVAKGEGVSGFAVGDEVWFCHGGLGREQGNYAEYTVIDEQYLSTKPVSVDYAEAAAAPLALITAWEALYDRMRLQPNETILIHAGAGGVGHIAIQVAKHMGARVCTTVSNEKKVTFVTDLGADLAVNYKEQNVVDAVMQWTGGKGVDAAFDTVGPSVFQATFPALSVYGRLVTLLDPGKDVDFRIARNKNLSIGFELMLTPMLDDSLVAARRHQTEILDKGRELIDTGKLRVHVGARNMLADAAQAHELVEAGHSVGKHVLLIGAQD